MISAISTTSLVVRIVETAWRETSPLARKPHIATCGTTQEKYAAQLTGWGCGYDAGWKAGPRSSRGASNMMISSTG